MQKQSVWPKAPSQPVRVETPNGVVTGTRSGAQNASIDRKIAGPKGSTK